MRRRVHSLLPALVFAASLGSACHADREPPLRVGTIFWPTNELLFLAQDKGWLNPSEFRLVEFVDDGEVMRGFRNHAIEAAWLTMDEVLAVAQSGAVDPVILFLSDESRGGDAVVAQPDLITAADLKDRRVAAQINSVGAYLLDRALKQAGLVASDVRLVNLSPYRHLNAFRRREVDGHAPLGPAKAAVRDAGRHTIAALLHRHVRQPHDDDGHVTTPAVDFDLNLEGIDSINSRRINFRKHGGRVSETPGAVQSQ